MKKFTKRKRGRPRNEDREVVVKSWFKPHVPKIKKDMPFSYTGIYEGSSPHCKFGNVTNRQLIKRIDKQEIDVRNVMRYALETGQLPREEYRMMDTSDFRRWLVINKITYEENQ